MQDETHRRLRMLKAERGDGSFDETIRGLLDQPEFTQDELKIIVDMLGDIQDTSNDPTIYPLCKSVSQKAYSALKRKEE